jgi:wyosine [tRNA(Phe)-imidazoG37] synthetase (radical SAM superfamily)
MSRYRYLFGPVPSRRLGRSLGVDLVPFKTCTLDCLFCEVGATTCSTLARKEYVPTDEVIAELSDWFREGEGADYITLAGSGEPTLHVNFGRILEFVSDNASAATAILSNGTLLSLPEVREDACRASLVKVSLSAWDQASYERLHRPCTGVSLDAMVESYVKFRDQFQGKLWIEVFLLEGVNTDDSQVARIARLVDRIGADRVHLNTAVRPPADPLAVAVSPRRLLELSALFSPPAEVVASFRGKETRDIEPPRTEILAMLKRRPCTAEQISAAFGIARPRVNETVRHLLEDNEIEETPSDGEIYLSAR